MTYDPSKESPRLTTVNGYDLFERSDGGFSILTSDGPVIDVVFPTFQGAANYAGTLKPGPKAPRRP